MIDISQLVVIVGRVMPPSVQLLGTAFAISNDGLFATTRHVVGFNDTDLVLLVPHITSINSYQNLSDSTCKAKKATIVEVHPVRDLAIIRITGGYACDLPKLGSFDNIKIGESVDIFGFPHCVTGRRVLTLQRTCIGAKVLINDSAIESKHAVINTQARPGQSGSPVFSQQNGVICGMLMGAWAPRKNGGTINGIDLEELHQTTHCISAEYIKEML